MESVVAALIRTEITATEDGLCVKQIFGTGEENAISWFPGHPTLVEVDAEGQVTATYDKRASLLAGMSR